MATALERRNAVARHINRINREIPTIEERLSRLCGEWWRLRPRIDLAHKKLLLKGLPSDNQSIIYAPILHCPCCYQALLSDTYLSHIPLHPLHQHITAAYAIAKQVEVLVAQKRALLKSIYVLLAAMAEAEVGVESLDRENVQAELEDRGVRGGIQVGEIQMDDVTKSHRGRGTAEPTMYGRGEKLERCGV